MSVHQQTGEAAPPQEEQPDKRPRDAHARRWNGRGWGFIVKLVFIPINGHPRSPYIFTFFFTFTKITRCFS